MDDATFLALRAALAASPDNLQLRGVLLDACVARDDVAAGVALLDGVAPDGLGAAHGRAAATLFWRAGRAAEGLPFVADDPDPVAGVLRARLLVACNRLDEARVAYTAAVRAQPSVEDPELGALIAQGADASRDAGGGRLLRLVQGGEVSDRFDDTGPDPRPPITFAEVGGLDEVKDRIRRRIILPMQKPSLFQRFRRKAGGGVLLYGPPGCGKTLLARATAGESKATFFDVRISDVLDMWIGESEAKLAALFDKARAQRPSVLFFDEVEALGGRRQTSRQDAGTKLVSQFLAEMDGFATDNEGVLVLGATNVPWAVDPAFRRPGRFERVLFVPPPDQAARLQILHIHLADRPVAADIDVAALARRTSGYSGADLEHLVETAADLAIEATLTRGDDVPISMALLHEALTEVKPTTVEWLSSARNYARYANEGGQYDEVLAFLDKHGKR